MFFESFNEAINMSGHGVFVWSAYGICFVVVAYLVLSPLRKQKRFFAEQSRRMRRDEHLAKSSPTNE